MEYSKAYYDSGANKVKVKTPSPYRYPYGFKKPYQQKDYSYISNYNDPLDINSMADVVFNREAKRRKDYGGLEKIPLLNVIPATIDLAYTKHIRPIFEEGLSTGLKITAVNALQNFSETMDVVANPVKALLMGENVVDAIGLGRNGRVNHDWDTGNWLLDTVAEVASDPLNWISLGGKAAVTQLAKGTASGVTETVLKSVAKMSKASDAFEKVLMKSAATSSLYGVGIWGAKKGFNVVRQAKVNRFLNTVKPFTVEGTDDLISFKDMPKVEVTLKNEGLGAFVGEVNKNSYLHDLKYFYDSISQSKDAFNKILQYVQDTHCMDLASYVQRLTVNSKKFGLGEIEEELKAVLGEYTALQKIDDTIANLKEARKTEMNVITEQKTAAIAELQAKYEAKMQQVQSVNEYTQLKKEYATAHQQLIESFNETYKAARLKYKESLEPFTKQTESFRQSRDFLRLNTKQINIDKITEWQRQGLVKDADYVPIEELLHNDTVSFLRVSDVGRFVQQYSDQTVSDFLQQATTPLSPLYNAIEKFAVSTTSGRVVKERLAAYKNTADFVNSVYNSKLSNDVKNIFLDVLSTERYRRMNAKTFLKNSDKNMSDIIYTINSQLNRLSDDAGDFATAYTRTFKEAPTGTLKDAERLYNHLKKETSSEIPAFVRKNGDTFEMLLDGELRTYKKPEHFINDLSTEIYAYDRNINLVEYGKNTSVASILKQAKEAIDEQTKQIALEQASTDIVGKDLRKRVYRQRNITNSFNRIIERPVIDLYDMCKKAKVINRVDLTPVEIATIKTSVLSYMQKLSHRSSYKILQAIDEKFIDEAVNMLNELRYADVYDKGLLDYVETAVRRMYELYKEDIDINTKLSKLYFNPETAPKNLTRMLNEGAKLDKLMYATNLRKDALERFYNIDELIANARRLATDAENADDYALSVVRQAGRDANRILQNSNSVKNVSTLLRHAKRMNMPIVEIANSYIKKLNLPFYKEITDVKDAFGFLMYILETKPYALNDKDFRAMMYLYQTGGIFKNELRADWFNYKEGIPEYSPIELKSKDLDVIYAEKEANSMMLESVEDAAERINAFSKYLQDQHMQSTKAEAIHGIMRDLAEPVSKYNEFFEEFYEKANGADNITDKIKYLNKAEQRLRARNKFNEDLAMQQFLNIFSYNPQEFLSFMVHNAKGVLTFSLDDLIHDELMQNAYNLFKGSLKELEELGVKTATDANNRIWFMLDATKSYQDVPEIKLKDMDYGRYGKYIDDEKFVQNYQNMLNQFEKAITETGTASMQGSLGDLIDDDFYTDLMNMAPEKLTKNCKSAYDFTKDFPQARIGYNFSNVGSIQARRELQEFYPTDIFKRLAKTTQMAAVGAETKLQYIHLLTDPLFSLTNSKLFDNFTDTEILDALKQAPQYTLAVYDDAGVLHKINPALVKDMSKLKKANPLLLPTTVYNQVQSVINKFEMSSKFLKYWHRLLYVYKVGQLASVGTVLRNAMDGVVTNMAVGESVSRSVVNRFRAAQMLVDYDEIFEGVIKAGEGRFTDAAVTAFFKNNRTALSQEAFQKLHNTLHNLGLGLTQAEKAYYFKDGLSNDMWGKFVNLSGKVLSPMERVETINRLSLYLTLAEQGKLDIDIFNIIAKNHFDFNARTKTDLLASLIFPYYTFTVNNAHKWYDLFMENGWLPSVLRDVMTPVWNFDERDYKDVGKNRSLQYQILNGNIVLDDGLVIKINPSFMDAYSLVTRPLEAVQDKLAPPLKALTDAVKTGKVDTNSLIPIVGTANQRIQSAQRYGERTTNKLPKLLPSVFGAVQTYSRRNFTPKIYPKYNSNYFSNRVYNPVKVHRTYVKNFKLPNIYASVYTSKGRKRAELLYQGADVRMAKMYRLRYRVMDTVSRFKYMKKGKWY